MAAAIAQAIAAYKVGDNILAERLCRLVLASNERHFDALNLLGIIARQMRRTQEALDFLSRAISVNPNNAFAHSNRGNVLRELNHVDEALISYDRAIKLKPDFADAHYNRGAIQHKLKRLEAALASYNRAIALKPDFVAAYYNRGIVQHELKQLEGAVTSYDHALTLRPDYAEAYYNRGVTLQELMKWDEALASYDRAITLKPGYMEAYANRGIVLHEEGRLKEALVNYDILIGLSPQYAKAYNNRGNTLKALKRYDEAIESYDRAIQINAGYAEAYSNRGTALQELNQWKEAAESFDQAIKLDPEYAEGHWNLAICNLSAGSLTSGWEEYEWRWKRPRHQTTHIRIAKDWDGSPPPGSLLVLPEQGVGDQIFYSGMLNDVRQVTNSVSVCVDHRLEQLYRRSFQNITILPVEALHASQHFDAQVYIASLGRYFRNSVSAVQNIQVPYLVACPSRAQLLRSQLAVKDRLLCGLSWISRNSDVGVDKSLSLKDLQQILSLKNVDFVDLQYGDTRKEQAEFYELTGIALKRIEEIDNFRNIDGLAALIEACDFVVTVSNTTAHLAAALGKPVFVMLPFSVGLFWYWHVERKDSVWYPTARLIRQDRIGDWKSVMTKVLATLVRELGVEV